MTRREEQAAPIRNVLVLIDLREMVEDTALDEVFYPESERVEASLITVASHHPLHPQFITPTQAVGGPLGFIKPKDPVYDHASLLKAQQLRVDAHWQSVRSHAAYRSLSKNLNFQNALKAFRRKRSGLYGHPYAEFRFVRTASWHVGTFLADPTRSTRLPGTKERKAAIGHIGAVLGDIDKRGVGFESLDRTIQLIKLLEELKSALSRTHRRPRQDETKPFRDFNMRLAQVLITTFGEASPVLVTYLARAAGCQLDDRTILSHVEEARKRGREKVI